MKVLILSCNTGEGHNSAAKAILHYFEERNISCDIKDALLFHSRLISEGMRKGYSFMCRHVPRLFDVFYSRSYYHRPTNTRQTALYRLLGKGCDALDKYISENEYDAVICCHVYAAMLLTELIKQGRCKPKTYLVHTDHVCHPGTEQTLMDCYFIPSKELVKDFSMNGIPHSKLVITGIPVANRFYSRLSRLEAKRKLNIDEGKRVVLVMGGSMGCGSIEAIAKQLPAKLPENGLLLVICGNNRRLYDKLSARKPSPKVRLVGYTDAISCYMDAAELILTKPGGLSCTEAAAKALPMLFFNALTLYERANADVYIKQGGARQVSSVSELSNLVCECLNAPESLKAMSNALEKELTGYAVQKIYCSVLGQALPNIGERKERNE